MILNSTKFGGNRTKDLEVGPDRQMDRQADSCIPPQTTFVCVWGGINIWNCRKKITIICPAINKEKYIVKFIATLFIQPKKDIVSEFVLYLQMVVKRVVSPSCMLFAEMA
jgi:hypothetical protein